jgi:hypothetical protein
VETSSPTGARTSTSPLVYQSNRLPIVLLGLAMKPSNDIDADEMTLPIMRSHLGESAQYVDPTCHEDSPARDKTSSAKRLLTSRWAACGAVDVMKGPTSPHHPLANAVCPSPFAGLMRRRVVVAYGGGGCLVGRGGVGCVR